jgi:putative monooxygenase
MTAPTTTSPTTTAPTPAPAHKIVSIHDVAANRRRGGDIRTILTPMTVGSKAGFMGTLTLAPGEIVTEHWHPYSEEFLFCVRGEITIRLNGVEQVLPADSGVLIPVGTRHRLVNHGEEPAFFVFCSGPLAPRPDLGHVDTEQLSAEQLAAPHTPVGTK